MDKISVSNSATISPEAFFKRLVSTNHAVAVYKLPKDDFVYWIADDQPLQIDISENIETIKGFLFTSFDKNRAILIKDSIFACQNKVNEDVIVEKGSFIVDTKGIEINFHETSIVNQNFRTIHQDEYEKWVKSSIVEINKESFEKVVLSRTKIVQKKKHIDPLRIFETLCKENANAFVSLVSIPNHGTWVGASPEILSSVDSNQIFKTVSLAGTQKADPLMTELMAKWGQKEIEEQALVSRYIINCLKKIRVREFNEIGPKTFRSGNLFHLKTEYVIDLNEINFENFLSVMVGLLHPTSAICGMPSEIAKNWIQTTENFDRSFFTGFLGPLHMTRNSIKGVETHLYVNIRTMQLLHDKYILYAGAGITSESNPTMEFFETENKMDALLKILNKLE
ncbi:MAG: chorismate-binding protein [Bacteroidota bacterium]|nr:chorismate-binding protein [Bacteroidota bacterium]